MIDLHTHSTASDGTDSPAQVVALAARAHLSAVAVTDHDTLDHLAEAGDAAHAHGIRLVPGCEISCVVSRDSTAMHLLVYFVDHDGPLAPRLADLQRARVTRNARIVERLRAAGVDVTVDDVLEEAGDGSVGRPHVAAVLVRAGVVASIDEAFDRWLGQGRPAYVERERLTAHDAIALARSSGGVTSLAHPGSLALDSDGLDELVAQLAVAGLTGLECDYGRYTPHERARLRAVAARHGLVPTGGSDYHGRYKPDLQVGVGRGDLAIPDKLLDDLESRRPARRSPSRRSPTH